MQRVDRWIDNLATRRYESTKRLQTLKGTEIKHRLKEFNVSEETLSLPEKKDLLAALIQRRSCTCAVCCEEFQDMDAYRQTPCGHGYHDACLREWVVKQATEHGKMPRCPVCCASIKPVVPITGCEKKVSRTASSSGEQQANDFWSQILQEEVSRMASEPPRKKRRDGGCQQQ